MLQLQTTRIYCLFTVYRNPASDNLLQLEISQSRCSRQSFFANYIDEASILVVYTLNKACINDILFFISAVAQASFDLIMGSSPSKGSGNRQTGPPGRERSTIKSAFNYHKITNNVRTCISCRCTAEHVSGERYLFQYR